MAKNKFNKGVLNGGYVDTWKLNQKQIGKVMVGASNLASDADVILGWREGKYSANWVGGSRLNELTNSQLRALYANASAMEGLTSAVYADRKQTAKLASQLGRVTSARVNQREATETVKRANRRRP